ncbi:MAG TPA: hypothetical protein VN957_05635 [Chthoniobacterales bacterium]|nr:hypothetical protein [Chthoniobacterales bacterium]
MPPVIRLKPLFSPDKTANEEQYGVASCSTQLLSAQLADANALGAEHTQTR